MDSVYSQAFTEVLEVLNNSEKSIISKIPNHLIELLNKYKDNNYNVKIDFSDENWDDKLKKETQAILAIIYRDYLVTQEERERLLIEEKKEKNIIENSLIEKYSPDNLFKNREKTVEKIETSVAALKAKKSIFTKIKNWFKRDI